ncbi:P-loop containing nucleoside triphosphate hydrolase protein [Chlamydoabsidia padenii]|nr:P-loop containing nucleoside triphosphate hydrolase protein [Chlamydoabsidia padenii]
MMIRGIARTTTRTIKTSPTHTLIRARALTSASRLIPVSLQQRTATSPLHKSWLLAAGLTVAFGGLTLASLQENVYALETTTNGDQICQAIVQNDFRTLRKLAEDPNFTPNVYHHCGWTPLQVAVIQDNETMVKFLLEKGADPNLEDHYYPRSHQAAHVRQADFSADLMPYRDYRDYTALHYAVIICNPTVVSLLLDHMADPLVRNSNGLTPREYLYHVERFTGEHNSEIDVMLRGKEQSFAADKEAHEERQRKEQAKQEKEYRKQHPLEDALKNRIVGQLGPIHALASAIRRKQNGWQDDDHPLVFLFCGSSGVGKTELAKTLANYVHGKNIDKGFIRIDMSEFQHKHDVSRFIGSPPGYVGYDEGGQLTEKLKECPNAVVLLDEVEKAHPDVLTVMLQLFDEGRITDGKGTTVECTDAIFIMTSNLAQHEIADEAELLRLEASVTSDAQTTGIATGIDERPQQQQRHPNHLTDELDGNDEDDGQISLSRQFIEKTIYPILYEHFRRDEFLGRINEVLFFLPFSEDELRDITQRELSKWAGKAKSRHDITMTWDSDVVDLLARGYNIRYGARSIKYEVERKVVNLIAKANENDDVANGGKVHVVVDKIPGKKRRLCKLEIQQKGGDDKKSGGGWFGSRNS